MVETLRQFGNWLKQGVGLVIDTLVAIAAWGVGQMNRLINTHWKIEPSVEWLVAVVVSIVVLLLIILILSRFWHRVRYAFNMVIDAIGWIFMALMIATGAFAGAGAIAFVILWASGHTNLVIK